MKYIELINNSWKLRRQGLINGKEWELYMYLLDVCNGLMWKNPFNQPTSVACTILEISRPTLCRRRNKLKQIGLIEFEEGSTNTNPPIYTIIDAIKKTHSPKAPSSAMAISISDDQAEDIINKVSNEEDEIPPQRIHDLHPGQKMAYDAGCLKNSSHLDVIGMELKISKEQIEGLLEDFLSDRKMDGKKYDTMVSLRAHFSNYCKKLSRKQVNNPVKSEKSTYNDHLKKASEAREKSDKIIEKYAENKGK